MVKWSSGRAVVSQLASKRHQLTPGSYVTCLTNALLPLSRELHVMMWTTDLPLVTDLNDLKPEDELIVIWTWLVIVKVSRNLLFRSDSTVSTWPRPNSFFFSFLLLLLAVCVLLQWWRVDDSVEIGLNSLGFSFRLLIPALMYSVKHVAYISARFNNFQQISGYLWNFQQFTEVNHKSNIDWGDGYGSRGSKYSSVLDDFWGTQLPRLARFWLAKTLPFKYFPIDHTYTRFRSKIQDISCTELFLTVLFKVATISNVVLALKAWKNFSAFVGLVSRFLLLLPLLLKICKFWQELGTTLCFWCIFCNSPPMFGTRQSLFSNSFCVNPSRFSSGESIVLSTRSFCGRAK